MNGAFENKILDFSFNFDLLYVLEGPALLREEKFRHWNNC